MKMGYIEIVNGPDGWSAGRITGNGEWGYIIYGEPDRDRLVEKILKLGYKIK